MEICDLNQMEDIRWKQRYDNLAKAYSRLKDGLDSVNFDLYHDLRRKAENDIATESDIKRINDLSLSLEGIIQRFEYTYELFINTLRDLEISYGISSEFLKGPRPVLEHALQNGLISDHDGWRKMIKARNLTSHTYNESTADAITAQIRNTFVPLMDELFEKLTYEYHRAN
ncbi:MAG: HI0074 family nucleotidyltransferase substrate-binding subunit [Cyclobacteriaceae bacterium]